MADISKKEDRPMERGTERRFPSPLAEMDRFFDEFFKKPFFSVWGPRMTGREMEGGFYPAVDMFEDGESVVLKAEIPGMKKEDLDIQLSDDRITISGKKSEEERVEKKDFFRLERSYGSFSRTLELPMETLTDKARATFKDGVLEVRIPKSPSATQRSRKVTVE